MSSTKSTGVKSADEFIHEAESHGLKVEVRVTDTPAEKLTDTLTLPAIRSIMAIVTIPVPDGINQNSVLALEERNRRLLMFWSKRDTPRSRGRWTGGNYSALGIHEDLHVYSRGHVKLSMMISDLRNLRKLANEN